MVLALTPLLLDLRFGEHVTPRVLELVRRLADKAIGLAGLPDAGIWEYREGWRAQTFSTLMCWAAADRAASVARLQGDPDADRLGLAAGSIRDRILAEAIDPARNALVADHGGTALDASMLQAATLRLLRPDDPRLVATIEAIMTELDLHGWLLRYRHDDGFGVPTVAFTLCTFWLVEALVVIGRRAEAEAILERALGALSPLGLLAEDFDPVAKRQHGNFPQAYAHVGLIHAAFAASPTWSEVL